MKKSLLYVLAASSFLTSVEACENKRSIPLTSISLVCVGISSFCFNEAIKSSNDNNPSAACANTLLGTLWALPPFAHACIGLFGNPPLSKKNQV